MDSWSSTVCLVTDVTSTTGESAVTVTVSWTVPTRISPSTVTVPAPPSRTPSRLAVVNPWSDIVTTYVPGRRSMISNRPFPSLTVVRTFSINTGLDASTVTPGSTAPDVSLTTPAIDACANARLGVSSVHASTNNAFVNTRIASFSFITAPRRDAADGCSQHQSRLPGTG